jgi:cell wall-associated NlpC family hydrolase
VGWTFRAGGRGPEGIDCFGLMLRLERAAGQELADLDTSDPRLALEAVLDFYAERHQPVTRGEEMPGDVLVFRGPQGLANHLGVYLGYGRFIHVCREGGVTLARLSQPAWQRRLAGIYRPV